MTNGIKAAIKVKKKNICAWTRRALYFALSNSVTSSISLKNLTEFTLNFNHGYSEIKDKPV